MSWNHICIGGDMQQKRAPKAFRSHCQESSQPDNGRLGIAFLFCFSGSFMSDDAITHESSTLALSDLSSQVADQFAARFGDEPRWIVAAPGRVNLIGEHTDYNGGFVLPAAIDRYVVMAGGPSEAKSARVVAADIGDEADLQVAGNIEPGQTSWSNYVQGVVAGFTGRGQEVPAFNALVRSTVPLGGGLSSSAALEVATATLLEAMLGSELDSIDKALLCQKAEHDFAGVPCGIMDQFSSVLCQRDSLMLLDCRSQSVEQVALQDPDIAILIANSNVKHKLTGGEYAQRRAECEQSAKTLGVETLRDATLEQIEAAVAELGDANYHRAKHVVSEIARTVQAVNAIRESRWSDVGQLMYASHNSLRDDYEVSCTELDLLVEIAAEIGEAGGVIGSRMTGGGFGGCTVTLLRTDVADEVTRHIREQYFQRTGIQATLFTTRPAMGAHRIK